MDSFIYLFIFLFLVTQSTTGIHRSWCRVLYECEKLPTMKKKIHLNPCIIGIGRQINPDFQPDLSWSRLRSAPSWLAAISSNHSGESLFKLDWWQQNSTWFKKKKKGLTLKNLKKKIQRWNSISFIHGAFFWSLFLKGDLHLWVTVTAEDNSK